MPSNRCFSFFLASLHILELSPLNIRSFQTLFVQILKKDGPPKTQVRWFKFSKKKHQNPRRKSGRRVIGVTYKVDGIHGSVGRIAVDRKTFVLLQGYDEVGFSTRREFLDSFLFWGGMMTHEKRKRLEERKQKQI